MDEAVKALVKVAMKKEQSTRPVRIHRIPKKRANRDLGTLSPYLREGDWTDKSATHFFFIEIFVALSDVTLCKSGKYYLWTMKIAVKILFLFLCDLADLEAK